MIRLVPLLLVLLLTACSTAPESRNWLTYRIDIRQGNMVTQEMAAQLKMGQSKEQVRFILGTPLVADLFHADRWDYVYRFQPGRIGGETEKRHLVVIFENGKLVAVGGDVIAYGTTAEAPAQPATRVIDIAPADGTGK
ncbi:MAG: outer membrane protein assembly factor BamE [Rhodocyclales bacterium]|nr:outer membrane protein assembly factor BamE [Rhodocyclales bacterium]